MIRSLGGGEHVPGRIERESAGGNWK